MARDFSVQLVAAKIDSTTKELIYPLESSEAVTSFRPPGIPVHGRLECPNRRLVSVRVISEKL